MCYVVSNDYCNNLILWCKQCMLVFMFNCIDEPDLFRLDMSGSCLCRCMRVKYLWEWRGYCSTASCLLKGYNICPRSSVDVSMSSGQAPPVHVMGSPYQGPHFTHSSLVVVNWCICSAVEVLIELLLLLCMVTGQRFTSSSKIKI